MVQFYKPIVGRLMHKVGKSGRIVGEKIRREGLGGLGLKLNTNFSRLLHNIMSPARTTRNSVLALRKAKSIALAFNIWAFVASFATLIIHNKYVVFGLQFTCLIAGIIIIATSKGLIKFFGGKKDNLPVIIIGFLSSSICTLLVSIGSFNLVTYYWIPFAIIIAIVFVTFLLVGFDKNSISPMGQIFFMLIFSLCFGVGLTIQTNCVFDNSTPQKYRTTIIDKYIGSGKGTYYEITLAAWLPDQLSKHVKISHQEYDRVHIEENVTVHVKPGVLQIPWFYVDL